MPTINEDSLRVSTREVTVQVFRRIFSLSGKVRLRIRPLSGGFLTVWPLLQGRSYRLRIVGGIETQVRAELPEIYEAFRSHFVGLVAELTPEYRSARCVIAPMISGTGISIKTIEALALGKPFVGTPKAYRGMPMDLLERAGLRACDTPQNFANAIVQLYRKSLPPLVPAARPIPSSSPSRRHFRRGTKLFNLLLEAKSPREFLCTHAGIPPLQSGAQINDRFGDFMHFQPM